MIKVNANINGFQNHRKNSSKKVFLPDGLVHFPSNNFYHSCRKGAVLADGSTFTLETAIITCTRCLRMKPRKGKK